MSIATGVFLASLPSKEEGAYSGGGGEVRVLIRVRGVIRGNTGTCSAEPYYFPDDFRWLCFQGNK